MRRITLIYWDISVSVLLVELYKLSHIDLFKGKDKDQWCWSDVCLSSQQRLWNALSSLWQIVEYILSHLQSEWDTGLFKVSWFPFKEPTVGVNWSGTGIKKANTGKRSYSVPKNILMSEKNVCNMEKLHTWYLLINMVIFSAIFYTTLYHTIVTDFRDGWLTLLCKWKAICYICTCAQYSVTVVVPLIMSSASGPTVSWCQQSTASYSTQSH